MAPTHGAYVAAHLAAVGCPGHAAQARFLQECPSSQLVALQAGPDDDDDDVESQVAERTLLR